jgi:hypothetical protein
VGASRLQKNLENVRIMKLNHPTQIRLDTVLENCAFYISTMYEFSHSLGKERRQSAGSESNSLD